jgi:hypothetical protein
MEYQSVSEIANSDIYKSKISKVSLLIAMAIFSFIYFLPKQISENPYLEKFFNPHNILVITLWLTLLACVGIYTILSFVIETSVKNKILRFELESRQELIFSNFLNLEVAKYNGEFLGAVFSTQDLARYILERENLGSKILPRKFVECFYNVRTINELTAMTVSETIVKKAEYKKLIAKTEDFPTLSESYEILIEFMN